MSGAARDNTEYAVPQARAGSQRPGRKSLRPARCRCAGIWRISHSPGTHLAAHYVIPHQREVGEAGARAAPRPVGTTAMHSHSSRREAGFELLDVAGEWVWGGPGPAGPSGWCRASDLAPAEG